MGHAARFLIIASLAIGLAGCQSFNVRTDWDPGVRFEELKRFFWVEPPEVEGANPFADNTLLRKRLHFGIDAELTKLGFAPTEERSDADFLVTYSVILEERIKVNAYSSTGGISRNHNFGFGAIHSTGSVRNYQESTLIIDFIDATNADLIWRGWGTGIVGTRDRGRNQERLAKGIEAILRKYPPRSQGN